MENQSENNHQILDTTVIEEDEIDRKKSRRVYLITYSHSNMEKFPTRESFGNMVAAEFTTNSVFVMYWACCKEYHMDGSPHYHMALKLNDTKRWLEVKLRINALYGIQIHFRENDGGYHSAYRYAAKEDSEIYHSVDHPDLREVGSPATKKAMRGYFNKRRSRAPPSSRNELSFSLPSPAGSSASGNNINLDTSVSPVPSTSRHGQNDKEKKCQRLTNIEVGDFVVKHKIRSRVKLLAVAKRQKNEGKLDLANFVFNRNKKQLNDLIDTAWEMENAEEELASTDRDRMQVIYDKADSRCVAGCEDRLWFYCATEVLQNNNIEPNNFAKAIVDLLAKGRGKFRNLLLVGRSNCAKTFLFEPLKLMYKVFDNPAKDKYCWVGADKCEIILINDLRWGTDFIAWDDLLRLLEGQKVNLPAPKNHFATDVTIEGDIPIFATSKEIVKHSGKFNLPDDREQEMMDSRWKVFHFHHRIPQEDIIEIPPCPRCFVDLVLLGTTRN